MSAASFYMDRESLLHRLHPITKILLLLLGFVSAFLVEHPLWLASLFLLYIFLTWPSGAIGGLRRVAWLLILIALASFVIWSLSYSGQTVLGSWGPFRVTREGLLFGAGMGLRLDLMIFCGLVFLAVTPVEDFTYGLTRLGLPFPLAFALGLSFRLMPLFLSSLRTIQEAQRARGLEPGKGLVGRFRSFLPLLVPVLMSSLRRADQLAIALESKGFGREEKRTSLREYQLSWPDALALFIMLTILALEVMARLWGWGMVR